MLRSRLSSTLTFVLAFVALNSCGDGNGGPESQRCEPGPYFDTLPIPLESIAAVKPLGEIDPPGDILPNAQTGFSMQGGRVPVVAPGTIRVRQVERTTWLESNFRKGHSDYSVQFTIPGCEPIYGVFAHLVSLAPALEELITDDDCEEATNQDERIVACRNRVSITLQSGDMVGTAGGGETASGLDFDFFDNRSQANSLAPDRYGVFLRGICMQPLFEEPLATQLLERVSHSGVQRTAEPRCGTLEVDIAGTAQGMWLREGEDMAYRHDTSENFLVLAPHVILPDQLQVLGAGAPELNSEHLHVFLRGSAGRVNRDFAELAPDDVIHCYHPATHALSAQYPGWDESSFLVALGSDGLLTVERTTHAAGASPCDGDPAGWTFSSQALHYMR